MSDPLRNIIAANRAGKSAAIPSICSAHRDVLRAAMLMPGAKTQPLLIEATSNQVNQDGGYTGMTPRDFVDYVNDLANDTGFPVENLIFGGDHLGPQAWKSQSADDAMDKAKHLVGDYVAAGFTKIHLDCSEGCAGEPPSLDDATVSSRAATLAKICEDRAPDRSKLSYIVGTEVPVPGGARGQHDGVTPTDPKDATATMNAHFRAFENAELHDAASRIVGLVVQPGVEFGAIDIDHLPTDDTTELSAALSPFDGLCFEAHSTDYQHNDAYPRLANMGFAIHKVGPALTFAYRQAVYALAALDTWISDTKTRLPDVIEQEMQDHPEYWQGHYEGSAKTLKHLRHFGYSDRIRYYWPRKPITAAVDALMSRLKVVPLPAPMVRQYFSQADIARADALPDHLSYPDRLILATIQAAIEPYIFDQETM